MEDWQSELWIHVYAATFSALLMRDGRSPDYEMLRRRAETEANEALEILNGALRK